MNTPICDFVRAYKDGGALRLHMPGHKGEGPLGLEALDITEIDGADSLYEASGIIRESEENASRLFGCPTFYSAEGSSLCIRAMVYLALLHAKEQGMPPLIAAGRNAHKTFMSAAALLDADVDWLYPAHEEGYLSCRLEADELDAYLINAAKKPCAVYLTSPDYLGNTVDLRAISAVCRRHGVLLLVDNAHGAYLRFLPESMHPVDLGADLCCDSAHKTLPVLTGGAYLHIAPDAPQMLALRAKDAMCLFGSTSPSYLILQSLDAANAYLADGYRERLDALAQRVDALRARLVQHGYALCGDEAIKLTIAPKAYGYTGAELARLLLGKGIVCEFSDPDYTVMMFTPETGEDGLARLEAALTAVERRPAIAQCAPTAQKPVRVMSVREATFAPAQRMDASRSAGRVLASASVGCPPAVPIVVCGERIDEAAVRRFAYYGVESLMVVREDV